MTAANQPWHFDRMRLDHVDARRFHVYAPRPLELGRRLRLWWWRLARRRQVVTTRIHPLDGNAVVVWAVESGLWSPPPRVRRLR